MLFTSAQKKLTASDFHTDRQLINICRIRIESDYLTATYS